MLRLVVTILAPTLTLQVGDFVKFTPFGECERATERDADAIALAPSQPNGTVRVWMWTR